MLSDVPTESVAEHKYKHILNVARIMMIHMHVLKYLWVDAVLSACNLINKMPSSVLHGKILFSRLYPNKNIFSVPPSVFVVDVLFRICL